MARGKHAVRSANRRAEAAHEVIDRLTSEVAELKIRTRAAEARAARLEGVEKLLAEHNNDERIPILVEKLEQWAQTAERDKKRRKSALLEVVHRIIPDPAQGVDLALTDRIEFAVRRWPKVMDALTAGSIQHQSWQQVVKGDRPAASNAVHESPGMSAERLRTLQWHVGDRTKFKDAWDRDAADVVIDLLDARQAGFNDDEIVSLVMEYEGSEE